MGITAYNLKRLGRELLKQERDELKKTEEKALWDSCIIHNKLYFNCLHKKRDSYALK